MTERLTAQSWLDFGLATLAHEGHEALKADALAKKLGVSRGSFYWHFADLAEFHSQLIEHWKKATTDAVIEEIERVETAPRRLEALLLHAFPHGRSLEIRMRAWAESNPEAARAVGEIEQRRRDYIERLIVEAGVPQPQASVRARLLYWSYLGAAWSHSRLSSEALEPILDEMKRIALGEASPEIQAGRSR